MSRTSSRGPKTVHGFNPPSSSPFISQPISIPNPSAASAAATNGTGSGGVKAVKLDLHRSNHAAPMPSPVGYFSSHSPTSHSPAAAAAPSVPVPTSFTRNNNVTLSVFDSQQSSAASSTGTTAPNSSNSSSQQISPSHAMLISPSSHAQPVSNNQPFPNTNVQLSSNASSTISSTQRSLSHSMPVSIPAFRRAASFVGMDTGFDLFASEIDSSFDGPASSAANANSNNKPKQQAPRIQNMGQLGQQLRQHLSQSNVVPTTVPPQQPAPAAAPSMQKTPSYLNMSDADALPDISSPPPSAALQFAFDSPDSNPNTVQLNIQNDSSQPPKQLLDFDAVGVNAKQQVLGAIPHVHTPPQSSPFLVQMNAAAAAAANPQQPPNPNHLFAPSASSRWAPLSSSAPSNLPSFNQMRRNSAGSVASSTISSHHPSKKPSSFSTSVQRRNDAHTPTTIASEDIMSAANNANNQTADSSMQQDDNDLDDDISDREVEALLSHDIHNDGSSCSLSSCSSCSGEDSDLSVNLEDDFDVKITFNPEPGHGGRNGSHHRDVFDEEEEDEIGDRLQARLNRDKRAHHAKRHLHHRRRRIRQMLKQQREEQRLAEASLHAEGDEIQDASVVANPDDVVSVGSYTHGERQGKIQRYMEKRARRVWSKKILYPSRKNFADNRVRVGGRFVKLKGNAAAAAAAGGSGGSGGTGGDESGSGSELAEANSAGPFSLSTSPWGTASAAHSPALAMQQMMLNSHASGAFSLPSFSNYLGTSASASPATTASERGSFSKPGGASTLSFIPEPLVASAASGSATGPSALSANLRQAGLARQLNAAAHPPAHSAPPASSNGSQ